HHRAGDRGQQGPAYSPAAGTDVLGESCETDGCMASQGCDPRRLRCRPRDSRHERQGRPVERRRANQGRLVAVQRAPIPRPARDDGREGQDRHEGWKGRRRAGLGPARAGGLRSMMDTIASPDCESTSLSPEVQESAVLRIAMARAECMRLGITPTEFAELLLPEVLLALMVDGMRQEEVN